MLAGQDGVDALFYQSLARPSNRIDVGLQGSRNPAAAPGFARVRRVSLQRNARVQQLPHLVLGLADQRGQPGGSSSLRARFGTYTQREILRVSSMTEAA